MSDNCLPDFSSQSQVKDSLCETYREHTPRIPAITQIPAWYFNQIQKAQNYHDAERRLVKPIPKHVSMVTPVQYPERRILHPLPAFLRRHIQSSGVSRTAQDQSRLPPKKRRYSPVGKDDDPPAKVSKQSLPVHSAASAFFPYVSGQARDPHIQDGAQEEKNALSADDLEVADIMKNSFENQYPILGYREVMFTPDSDFTDDDVDEEEKDEFESDDEIVELNEIIQDLKSKECQSPREPWIPGFHSSHNATKSDKFEFTARHCFKPISPVIVSPDSSGSGSSIQAMAKGSDSDLSLSQFSPISISSGSSIGSISDFSTPVSVDVCNTDVRISNTPSNVPGIAAMVEIGKRSSQKEKTKGRAAVENVSQTLDNIIDLTEEPDEPHENVAFVSTKPQKTMEELRRSVLTGAKAMGRCGDGMPKSEGEKFAEILEDFLEENGDLPPDIRGDIVHMLVSVRDNGDEQKASDTSKRERKTRLSPKCEKDRLVETRRYEDRDLLMAEERENKYPETPEPQYTGTSSRDDRLFSHVEDIIGHDCFTDYRSHQNNQLRAAPDRAFYDVFGALESPISKRDIDIATATAKRHKSRILQTSKPISLDLASIL